MKKAISITFILVTILFFFTGKRHGFSHDLQEPGEGMTEEGDSIETMLEKYMALIHRAAPGVVWQNIEEENRKRNILLQDKLRYQLRTSKTSAEIFANGKVLGTWYERGSRNQAGRIYEMEYDNTDNTLYAISACGDFWKGNVNGSGWQSQNDRDKLVGFKLVMYRPTPTTRRFLAFRYPEMQVYYSDDDGVNWSPAIYDVASSWPVDKLIKIDNAQQTIFQSTGRGGGPNTVHLSNDGGLSFKKLNLPSDFVNGSTYCSLAKASGLGVIYLFNANKALYTVDGQGKFTKLGSLVGLPASSLDLTQPWHAYEFRISRGTSGMVFYALIDYKNLYKSPDGLNWQFVSSLPTSAGGYTVFNADPNNPNWLSYGEVELYNSTDGGNTWTKVNNWVDYYGNVNKLHADLMSYKYFQQTNGQPIQFVSNDGGMYMSTNNFVTSTNIGLQNLNVSQYYDVATDPINSSFIWGGSQDQGLQRTANGIGTTPVDFSQFVSGDYTSMDFFPDSNALLTQYPGGLMYYVSNVRGAFSYQIPFQITGPDKGNGGWHLPVCPIPGSPDNAFWVGGGNMNNAAGSFVIRLSRNSSNDGFVYTQRGYNFSGNSAFISAVKVSPVDTNRLYVATEDGRFYYSSNAGTTFAKTASFIGPFPGSLTPTSILVSKKNKDIVSLGGSGYSNPPFYRSADGGKTFIAASTGLPSTTIYDLTYNAEEDKVFAATEAGPYVYVVADNQWYSLLGSSCPLSCNYFCVEFVPSQNIVRFGTYGRGIFDLNLESSTVSIMTGLTTAALCAGSKTTTSYSSNNANFAADNVFAAQLSDPSGSFAHPVTIGTVASTSATGTISITIPPGTSGGNYLIRTTSSDPSIAGDASSSLTINALPSAPTISAGGSGSLCLGGTLLLTSTAANGNHWYKDGMAVGTSNTLTITEAGTYNVKVVLNGCESGISNSIIAVVNPIPSTPTISADGPTSFCEGSSLLLTSSAADSNHWYRDGTVVGTSKTLTVTQSGSYNVKVVSNGCESGISPSIIAVVNPIPFTPVITQNGDKLMSSASTGNQWYLNGVPLQNDTSNTYAPTGTGLYTVQVTVNNCSSPMSASFSFIVTGINSPSWSNELRIYPNPVHKTLFVSSTSNRRFSVQLFDATGRLVKQTQFVSTLELNVESLPGGDYMLKIEDEKKKSYSRLIIKQ
ncbi:MAG TPA: T9SS type A sorting domain-containing protein [Chitinophagaceae bacterium]|jgi:photosystem II stability/assembly factor-like uncharacterized protein|nr:T9SS type A sorting domain-containing protein [Chitinophagaceae bacterium]